MKRNNIVSLKNIVKEELLKDKYVKTALFVVGGVLSFYALGYVFKIANFTIGNFKNLNATLKR
jgi:hypothetical protein